MAFTTTSNDKNDPPESVGAEDGRQRHMPTMNNVGYIGVAVNPRE